MDDELILTLTHPVATLTLNREELRNAISFPMYKRIPELIGRVQADPRVKVLVIRGCWENSPSTKPGAIHNFRRSIKVANEP